jgi:hypothetical protein
VKFKHETERQLIERIDRRTRFIGGGMCVGFGVVFVWLGLLTAGVFGAEFNRLSTPRDAVALAIADCTQLPESSRPFARYFWLPEGSEKELAAFGYTLNAALSNAQSLQYGRPVSKNLVAIDLRSVLPDATDFARVFGVLESYVDPYFHVVQRVQVVEAGQFVVVVSKVAVLKSGAQTIAELPRGRGGKVVSQQGEWIQVITRERRGWVNVKDVAIVSFGLHVLPRPELDGERIVNAELLADLTQSRCPVFTYPLFQSLSLTTIDGGIYYDLIGVEGLNLSQSLSRFGVDQRDFTNADATNRSAVFVSRVTSRPRAGIFGFASGIRPTDGTGLWTATEDIAEKDADPEQDAIDNLAGAKFTAGEAILQRSNGFLAGLAYNAAGVLQDEVPPDVARDNQAPAPFHARINGWFSCMRCHEDTGYQDFGNDVKAITNAGGLIFGDFSAAPGKELSTVDQLRAQYAGDLTRPLDEARRAHAAVVFRATGKPYEEVRAAVVSTYESYENSWVTPQIALRWIGYECKEPEAKKLFAEIVPPLPANVLGVSPEDAAVLGLRAYDAAEQSPLLWVRRFERIYPDLALRAMTFKGGGK